VQNVTTVASVIPELWLGPRNLQEALQMQRDCKYDISHSKRLAIGELRSRTLKVITIAAIR